MILTIYGSRDSNEIQIASKDERFKAAFGMYVRVPNALVYANLSEIADWINNEIKEECLFEVD